MQTVAGHQVPSCWSIFAAEGFVFRQQADGSWWGRKLEKDWHKAAKSSWDCVTLGPTTESRNARGVVAPSVPNQAPDRSGRHG